VLLWITLASDATSTEARTEDIIEGCLDRHRFIGRPMPI
jgi:hypothetical protein